jgi:hypothetical protein
MGRVYWISVGVGHAGPAAAFLLSLRGVVVWLTQTLEIQGVEEQIF